LHVVMALRLDLRNSILVIVLHRGTNVVMLVSLISFLIVTCKSQSDRSMYYTSVAPAVKMEFRDKHQTSV